MNDSASIAVFLQEEGIRLSGPVVRRDEVDGSFFAFIEVSKDAKGHQKPSNVALKSIADNLATRGVAITFILNDVSTIDFEAGLRATLLHSFPSLIRNVFLINGPKGATVWIVPKSENIKGSLEEIVRRVEIYLNNADLPLDSIKLSIDENLPSRTAILAVLRIIAPASMESLLESLALEGFDGPPQDYVNRHLDALRRADYVVRRQDGKYCLSAGALKALGTRKSRSSPDVRRLLDLVNRNRVS